MKNSGLSARSSRSRRRGLKRAICRTSSEPIEPPAPVTRITLPASSGATSFKSSCTGSRPSRSSTSTSRTWLICGDSAASRSSCGGRIFTRAPVSARRDPSQRWTGRRHRAEPADEDQHGNEGDRPQRDRGDDLAEVADADEMPVAAKQPGPMEQGQPDDEEIWKGLDVAAELVRRGPEVEAQGVREEVGERDEREVTNDGNRAPIATQESKRFHRRCRLVLHLLCSDLTCLAMGRGASTLSA